MALILNDPSLDRRQLSYLMAARIARGLNLPQLRWQAVSAVLALLRQHRSNLIDSFGGDPRAVRSVMAGLSAHFPLTLLPPAPFARCARQSIGGWRLGRVRGVLFAKRQLAFQIHDPLFFFRDSLRVLGQLLAQAFVFTA